MNSVSYHKIEDKKIDYVSLSKHLTDIVSNDVFIMEDVKGLSFKIVCKDKISFSYEKEHLKKDVDKFFTIFNRTIVNKIRLLRKKFGKADIVIFVKGLKKEDYFDYEDYSFVFTDIYVNSNWVLQDDIIEFFKEVDLPTPKVLYEGLYSYEAVKDIAENTKSEYSKKDIPFGFCIKTRYEDGVSKALSSRKVFTFPSAGYEMILKEEEKKLERKSQEYFEKLFVNNTEQWKIFVQFKVEEYGNAKWDFEKKKIIEKTNDLIMDSFNSHLINLSAKNKLEYRKLEKSFRKKIGEYTFNNFFLKKEDKKNETK